MPMGRFSTLALSAMALGLVAMLGSCAAPPTTSERYARFRTADLYQAVSNASASLSREVSDGFKRSGAATPGPLVVRAEPMTNLSLDRFTPSEERLVVARVLSDPRVLSSFRDADISLLDPEASLRADATHRFVAQIRSIAREGASGQREANARRDAYLLEYQLLDNQSGLSIWQHAEEVARRARGLVID